MKDTRIKLLVHATFLFGVIAYTVMGLEFFIFQSARYNVYRVLDISAQGLFTILFFLAVQYVLYSKLPIQLSILSQAAKSRRNIWLSLIAFSLAGTAVFSLLPLRSPFWIFFPLSIGLIGFSILVNHQTKKLFHKAILLLIFAAGLNASLIFWMHEEANEGRHIQYARQLAERRDTIAENQLIRLVERAKRQPDQLNNTSLWERHYLENDYLASNYRLNIDRDDAATPSSGCCRPLLNFDESSILAYQLYLPDRTRLTFRFKDNFTKSVYTANQPYKHLDRLSDYQFAVVDRNAVVLANTHNFDLNILDVQLPAVGKGEKIEWNGFDVTLYRHTEEIYVLIGEPLSEVQVWVSNFALFFSLFMVVTLLLELVLLLFNSKDLRTFWQRQAIQFRIQATLIALTLLLFFVIAATTFFFLRQNNQELAYERQLYTAETARKAIVEDLKLFDWRLAGLPFSRLADLADRKQCDIDLYNEKGELMASSIARAQNSPARQRLEETVRKQLIRNPSAILVDKSRKNDEDYLRTVFSISIDRKPEGFVVLNTFESEIGTAQDIPIIMSKLLNVYVFLLLIAWSVGLLLVNLLTHPLRLLANRLSRFKPGEQNEKLDWAGDDAIGQLIGEYNSMVDVVEKATRELARTEREGAWQTMAQQIAHEINNTLTPLRLNIQFLTRMLDDPRSIEPERARQITHCLVEQIDSLAGVAAQFRAFAKLETPEAKPLDLKQYLESFFEAYERQERFDYRFVSDLENGVQPVINIDVQHFRKILLNILNNAERSIPEDRKGRIMLRLKESEGRAIVEIEDNGKGIDESIGDRIFDPRFRTDSSSTGLGLPICRRILEYYEGDLSFATQSGKGTCFKIAFALAS